MDKKTFALNAIRPYAKDPITCGYNGVACVYFMPDGRKCVAGKFMLDPNRWMESGAGIREILKNYPQEEVFRPEAVGILDTEEWALLQSIHDNIAQNDSMYFLNGKCKELGLFSYDEMIAE